MSATVRSWNDLRQFGIDFLTGESCGIGLRCLCDLDERGRDALISFFGGRLTFEEGGGWNSGVASIMLPYGILKELACFLFLFNDFYMALYLPDGSVQGWRREEWDEAAERVMEQFGNCKMYRKTGTAGLRNVHQISGRTT